MSRSPVWRIKGVEASVHAGLRDLYGGQASTDAVEGCGMGVVARDLAPRWPLGQAREV